MGKSQLMFAVAGKSMHWGPRKPVMYLCPTERLAKRVSKARVLPMFKRVPDLNALIDHRRTGTYEIIVAGTMMHFAWMGSPTEMSSVPVCYVLVDEIDQNTTDLHTHGDPLKLAGARMKMFGRQSCMLNASTPTVAGQSIIWRCFMGGSMEIYCGRCEHCDEFFYPEIALVRWPKDCSDDEIVEASRLVCPHCGAEHDKKPSERRYIPHRAIDETETAFEPVDVPVIHRVRSFWVHGLWSPMITIGELARRVREAYRSHDQFTVQACLNTDCGELYRVKGDRPQWQHVYGLREEFDSPAVQVVTMGVDVQRESLFYVVRGWGYNWESWLLDFGQLNGDTNEDPVWELLDNVRGRVFEGRNPDVCFIDSGFNPLVDRYIRPEHKVHEYCRLRAQCHPTVGRKTLDAPISRTQLSVKFTGQPLPTGVRGYRIHTHHWKVWLYDRIRRERGEPGAWHVPMSATEDYCKQVTNEELVTLSSGGFEWRTTGTRQNHYLDCEILAAAGGHLCNVSALRPSGSPDEPPPEPSDSLARRTRY